MTFPNFLVIGAPRAGTTALYQALRQHPAIYMSPGNEPRFFAYEGETLNYCGPGDREYNHSCVTSLVKYLKLFEGVRNEVAIGEKSPIYMTLSVKASERIQHYVPDIKIIAILRHPADRAYSNYLRLVRDGRERLPFSEALKAEEARHQANWSPPWLYTQRGYYAAQLKNYLRQFDRQQIRIYFYEDWIERPMELLSDLFEFLWVDRSFVPDLSVRHNESKIPRSRTLYNLLVHPSPLKNCLRLFVPEYTRRKISTNGRKMLMMTPSPLDATIRQQLIELYRSDILELQILTGRDLTPWLER